VYKAAKEEIGEWRKLAGNGDWEGGDAREERGDAATGRRGDMEKRDEVVIRDYAKKGVPLPINTNIKDLWLR
jgi:hypothetical protein